MPLAWKSINHFTHILKFQLIKVIVFFISREEPQLRPKKITIVSVIKEIIKSISRTGQTRHNSCLPYIYRKSI
jgi:hypothetical protein